MRRRTQQKNWARVAALVVVTAVTSPAVSQPAPAGGGTPAPAATDPAVAAAVKQAYAAGRAAADAKQWPKAVEEFGKAYALKPLPQLAGNLGEAELQVGRFRDAAEHVSIFLREDKGALSEDKKAGEAWLKEAKKKIVTLKITVDEAGAEVLVDDKVIGVSPLPPEVYVDPGQHTIVARKGTARVEVVDTYQAGWTRVMKLVPKEAGAVPTPTAVPTTSSGAGRGESTGPRKELVIGGAAVGGVLLVAGAIFAGVSASKAGEAGALSPGGWDKCYGKSDSGPIAGCNELHALHQETALFGNLATGMFLSGALVGGATLLYALRILPPGRGPKKAAFSAMPVVTPSAGGISLAGSF